MVMIGMGCHRDGDRVPTRAQNCRAVGFGHRHCLECHEMNDLEKSIGAHHGHMITHRFFLFIGMAMPVMIILISQRLLLIDGVIML